MSYLCLSLRTILLVFTDSFLLPICQHPFLWDLSTLFDPVQFVPWVCWYVEVFKGGFEDVLVSLSSDHHGSVFLFVVLHWGFSLANVHQAFWQYGLLLVLKFYRLISPKKKLISQNQLLWPYNLTTHTTLPHPSLKRTYFIYTSAIFFFPAFFRVFWHFSIIGFFFFLVFLVNPITYIILQNMVFSDVVRWFSAVLILQKVEDHAIYYLPSYTPSDHITLPFTTPFPPMNTFCMRFRYSFWWFPMFSAVFVISLRFSVIRCFSVFLVTSKTLKWVWLIFLPLGPTLGITLESDVME